MKATARRPERRGRIRYRARLSFILKSNGQEVRGITRNVSLLGFAAHTDGSMSQAQPVECLLAIPRRREPLLIRGTITRCEALAQPHPDGPYETGVFFKEFEEKGETLLVKYLERSAQHEEAAIKAGYRAFRQKIRARRRRKRLEELRKRARRTARLQRKRRRLARQKRMALSRPQKPESGEST